MMIPAEELKEDFRSLRGAAYRDVYAESLYQQVIKDIRGRLFHFFHREEGKALRWIDGEGEFIRTVSIPVHADEKEGNYFPEEILRRLRDRGIEGDITVSITKKRVMIYNGNNFVKKEEEIYLLRAGEKGLTHTSLFTSRPTDVFLDGFVNELREKQRIKKNSRPLPREGEMFLLFTESAASFFAHEILWHPLELDLVLKGESFLSLLDRGKTIFPPEIFLTSSSQIPDDEGNPPGEYIMIEEGRVVNFASSVFYSLMSGQPLVPHGRRQDYRNPPEIRPSKTVIHPGELSQLEILRKINHGILIRGAEKAWLDFSEGRAIFRVTMGYWIERGEITFPLPPLRVWVQLPLRQIWLSTELNREEKFFCVKNGQKIAFTSLSPDFLVKGFAANE